MAALAFVPSDRDRGLERGHHPAERLARELGRRWALPVTPLLGRTRPSLAAARAVTRRAPAQRRAVRSSLPASRRPGSSLVDDVYTSGATAYAAASALRKAGARRVDVVTFARVVR